MEGSVLSGFIRAQQSSAQSRSSQPDENDRYCCRSTRHSHAKQAPVTLYTELLSRPSEVLDCVAITRPRRLEIIVGDDEVQEVTPGDADLIIVEPAPGVGSRRKRPRPSVRMAQQLPVFLCDVCDEMIGSITEQAHEGSILHIFNMRKQLNQRRIMLPDSNRGVKILTKMGWNTERGLGKEEQGAVQPVKTFLKTDRTGLGHKKQGEARITHFPAHQANDAGPSAAELAQKRFEEQKAKSKQRQRSVTYARTTEHESAQDRERRIQDEKGRRQQIHRELHDDDLPEDRRQRALIEIHCVSRQTMPLLSGQPQADRAQRKKSKIF